MRSPQNASNVGTPEKTIFQPRPISPPSGQQTPDKTIFQPRKDHVEAQKNNLNVLQILAIILAAGLLLDATYYFVSSKYRANDREVPRQENL